MSDKFFNRFFLWLRAAIAIAAFIPCAAVGGTSEISGIPKWLSPAFVTVGAVIAFIVWVALRIPLDKWRQAIEKQARSFEMAIDKASTKWISGGIICAVALSLILELALIRWEASLYEVFGFYKNFILLACFAGLGVGYASAMRPLLIAVFLPVMAINIAIMTFLRYVMPDWTQACLHTLPSIEQLAMGTGTAYTVLGVVNVYCLLIAVFGLTSLTSLPVGQLCGRLMTRLNTLQAYGLNLIGSFVGIICMLALSYIWSPPVVWFALAFCLVLPFLALNRRTLAASTLALAIALGTLGAALPFGEEMIYSPYQLLKRGKDPFKQAVQITAAGQYYQRILDLSEDAQSDPKIKTLALYYGMPYNFKKDPPDVLVIGAGTGNDVAAALRAGAGHVDAVEIDPAIHALGKIYHPERPYHSDKVSTIINDARQYLRTTNKEYDVIVYGLLDSHVATSQSSQLRTDSYVYTVEAFNDARRHLKKDGIICLSFATVSPELDLKLKSMLHKVFGSEPLSIRHGYDKSTTMLHCQSGIAPQLPEHLHAIAMDGKLNLHPTLPTNANIDLSTDDWPFFYMPRKAFPMSYVPVLGLLIAMTWALLATFSPQNTKPSKEGLAFMLLGIGFMLIETKAITELGLYFGNTWQVTGLVIMAIMIMAFLANLSVEKFKPSKLVVPYLLIVASIVAGMYAHHNGLISSDGIGPALATGLATLPLAFSGIVFSMLLAKSKDISNAMSMNLFGALLGGALEYLSMWLGYESLYIIAIAVYTLAVVFAFGAGDKEVSAA